MSKIDKRESLIISQLIQKLDQIDAEYVNKESDVIFQKQPFLISLLLGYRIDLKELELAEVMRVLFLIWEYFKNLNRIDEIKISEFQFDRVQNRNIHMLKYFEREQGQRAKLELVASDLEHLKSKALFTGIIFQFNRKDALLEMKMKDRGIILVGLKSLIECFEEIVYKN